MFVCVMYGRYLLQIPGIRGERDRICKRAGMFDLDKNDSKGRTAAATCGHGSIMQCETKNEQ